MHKSVVVVVGVVASVMAAGGPERSAGGPPINLHVRDHTRGSNETRTGDQAPPVNLPETHECGNTVYIPVTVTTGESFWETGFSTTITVTTYVLPSSLNATKPTVVPTGGTGSTYPATLISGPAFANVTKPAGIGATVGTANVTPSMNPLLVPLLGLNSSAISTPTGSYGLPRISASTGSYGLPKTSTLTGSFGLPRISTLSSQGTPGTRAPFGQVKNLGAPATDGIVVGLLFATFLTITGSQTSLF